MMPCVGYCKVKRLQYKLKIRMRQMHIIIKKILNWDYPEDCLNVRVSVNFGNLLFYDTIQGQKSKNMLRLDTIFSVPDSAYSCHSIQIGFETIDSHPIGELNIELDDQLLEQEYSYISIPGTNFITQIQVRDIAKYSKIQLAKDCIEILNTNATGRLDRLDQIQKTNTFISRRGAFLQQYMVQCQMPEEKKPLNRFIRELSRTKEEIRCLAKGNCKQLQQKYNQQRSRKRFESELGKD